MSKRTPAAALAAAVTITISSAAFAQYSFRELDTNGFPIAQVRDVANGMAVGYGVTVLEGDGEQHALAWPLNTGGARIDLDHGYRKTEAIGVDNAHHIAGDVRFVGLREARPGYWPSPNAAPIDYAGNLNYSYANATQGNQIIGWGHRLQAPDPVNDAGFIWDVPSKNRTALPGPDGAMVTYGRNLDGTWAVGSASVPTPSGYMGAAAWDISNLSSIRAINLHPTGFDYSDTNAVHDGKAVGLARQGPVGSDFNHAYLWDLTAGTARDLHALLPASMHAVGSSATDLRGDFVVGQAMDAAGNLWGVAWDLASNRVIDLRQFMPAGTTFSSATALNDDGQIVGDWWKTSDDRNVFVLTPDRMDGDSDNNGVINFDDYVHIDNGFNSHINGWANGDFDHNGVVNFDDYVLIDLAFNNQNGSLSRALALLNGADPNGNGMTDPALRKVRDHLAEFGSDYANHFAAAVPEPTVLGLTGVMTSVAMLSRRRRRSA